MESDNQLSLYATYLPAGIAHGIIGTLIPLFLVQRLGASLVDLGVMAFAAAAILIPASIFLGSLPDKNRVAKPYILLSFLGASIILYLMTRTADILLFQLLFVALELFSYLRGPSTSVLIAETFERKKRSLVIAREGFVEGIGAVAGLGACSLLVGQYGYEGLLFVAAPLTFASFVIALFTISDSPLYIERNLDRFDGMVDRMEDLSFHLSGDGSILPSMDGEWRFGRVANMRLFALGRAVFAFAASNAFTTISIFLLSRVGLSSSTIFLVFLVRSLFGSVSYLFVDRVFGLNGGVGVTVGTLIRVVVVLLFPVVLLLPQPFSVIVAAVLLVFVAVSWSIYSVGFGLVTIAYAQPGSLGLYDSLASVGGALGNYSGGLIPTLFGFETLFFVSGLLFAVSLVLFYLSRI